MPFGFGRSIHISRQSPKGGGERKIKICMRHCVFDAVREFARGARVEDDMTLVIAKFHERG